MIESVPVVALIVVVVVEEFLEEFPNLAEVFRFLGKMACEMILLLFNMDLHVDLDSAHVDELLRFVGSTGAILVMYDGGDGSHKGKRGNFGHNLTTQC